MIDTSRKRLAALGLLFGACVSGSVLVAGDGPAALRVRTVSGGQVAPFAPAGKANVLFFVATDCPVSNSYAPEIQRVCREYGPRGVGCVLVYEDVDLHPRTTHLDQQVRAQLTESG